MALLPAPAVIPVYVNVGNAQRCQSPRRNAEILREYNFRIEQVQTAQMSSLVFSLVTRSDLGVRLQRLPIKTQTILDFDLATRRDLLHYKYG